MTVEANELRKYLMGDLPEPSADLLDARLFADDELVRELECEQDSLIEDFLTSGLTSDDEARFRSQVARSPLLQQKVEFGRILLAALKDDSASRQRPSPSLYTRFAMVLAPSLALLLCILTFLYAREFRQNAALESQLQANSHTPPAVSSSAGNLPVTIAFLSANVVRGASSSPEISVSASGGLLELQLELRATLVEEDLWDAEIMRGSSLIWKSSQLPLQRAGREEFLALFLELKSVPPGNYEVRYKPSSSADEQFQVRAFRISRRR